MAKRIKKQSKTALKLEALETRQLLAGVTGAGTEVTPGGTGVQGDVAHFIQHPNGNKYDQVLLTGGSVSVTNDPGQITRVSFLDLNNDVVQAEFSGSGTLTVSMADGYTTGVAPTNYNQAGVTYVQGLASFTISGSDATTSIAVFSVGKGNAINTSLFDSTHNGGDHLADVARISIVANPSNPNGSIFGGIYAGNAKFSADSGVVGITASNVQVQDVVRVGDIVAKSSATPTLIFGTNSQFGSVDVTGGGLIQTNGKAINNTGSYIYSINEIAGSDSTVAPGGTPNLPAQSTSTQVSFTASNPFAIQNTGKILDLSAGVDTVTGGSGDDTIRGYKSDNTANYFTSLDNIDGGAGTDTLSIITNGAINTTNAVSAKVTNVEKLDLESLSTVTVDSTGYTGVTNVNTVSSGGATVTASGTSDVTVSDNALAAGAITVTGGKTLTVTGISQTTGTITTSGAKGAVTVTSSGDYTDGADITLGAISVTGGTTISVNQTSGITSAEATAAKVDPTNFTVTQSAVTVKGDATTTSVSVSQDKAVAFVNSTGTNGVIGVTNGGVTVNDVNNSDTSKAGTIASVTLNNFGAATIDSSALTSVTLSGTGTSLGIGRGNLTATPTANTLTANVSGLTLTGTLTDSEAASDDGFTTLNIAATGSGSKINDVNFADATALNVSGDKALELTNLTGIANVTAITVTNTGGLTIKSSALGNNVVFAGGSGADSIQVNATTKAITMGAGNDTVQVNTSALGTGGSIDGGDGTDTLQMSDANAVTASATNTFAPTFTNFEKLSITGTTAANQNIQLNNLNNLNSVSIAGVNGGNTLTLSGAQSGFTLSAGSGAAGTVAVSLANAGSADVANIGIDNNSAKTIGGLDLTGFETINLNPTDSKATGIAHVITTLTAPDATSIKVTGTAGLTLTTATSATKLTTFDASGVSKGNVSFTTGALTNAATLTGGAGNDTLNASAATKAVTINGGAGNDTLTASSTKGSTLNGGDGDDTLVGGADADVVDGNAGSNTFSFGTLTEQAGASTTVGAVINLSSTALTQSGVFTATGNFLASVSPTVASNTATYLFNGESSTNVSVVDTLANVQNATGTSGTDYIVGSGDANVITGGGGADIITTGGGADTVALTTAASADTVTDFSTGLGGDIASFSIAGLGQTFKNGNGTAVTSSTAVSVKELGAAGALGATDNVVVLTGTFANAAAAKTAIEAGGSRAITWNAAPAANADFVLVWSDGTNTHVSTVNDANTSADTALEAGDATITDLAVLNGINTIAAGNFVASNFSFVV
ncbi:MAG TPA: hypothetical protein VHD62_03915 [Opitutaceae bacterium]|nr:hypothetical protein [Opitutaceae bacterium]